jgi:hypothetical protein
VGRVGAAGFRGEEGVGQGRQAHERKVTGKGREETDAADEK